MKNMILKECVDKIIITGEDIDIYLCDSLSGVVHKAYEVAKEKQVVL